MEPRQSGEAGGRREKMASCIMTKERWTKKRDTEIEAAKQRYTHRAPDG